MYVPLSLTASQIWYGPSHLNDNLRDMFFLRLVSCSKIILSIANSSSQIPCFRLCRSFPSRGKRYRWRVASSRSLSWRCNWRACLASKLAVKRTLFQGRICQVGIFNSIGRTSLYHSWYNRELGQLKYVYHLLNESGWTEIVLKSLTMALEVMIALLAIHALLYPFWPPSFRTRFLRIGLHARLRRYITSRALKLGGGKRCPAITLQGLDRKG